MRRTTSRRRATTEPTISTSSTSGLGAGPTSDVLRFADVSVVIDGCTILSGIDWAVRPGEHVAMLGPNGAGKTTVLRLLAGYLHPTCGTVDVLGNRLGDTDVRRLRRRIGIVSDGIGELVDRRSRLGPLVAASRRGMTTEAGARLHPEDLDRAHAALTEVGIVDLADRRGTSVSEGEWKRALLARCLVVEPDLLLLDEPCTGLDLAERERFLVELDELLLAPDGPTTVVVTHHLEEVPSAVSHALLLRDGRVDAEGPIGSTLTDHSVSRAFGIPVELTRRRGRLTAIARSATHG